MNNTSFDAVFNSPHPTLDEKGSKEQSSAYRQALQRLLESKTTITSIPAGAGSGKTRTLVAIITGLLRMGVSPDLIESISFTNASADEFRNKLIKSLVSLSEKKDSTIKPYNLGFSTIHKHAIDLLKKLEPHIGGVGYYFEDAQSSGDVNGHDKIELEEKQKSIRLALYSTMEYDRDNDVYLSLKPFFEIEGNEEKFILKNINNGNHKSIAHDFIRKDMMSDAGLGAFTNIDDNNPDFCLAVAIDSLMRLYSLSQYFDIDTKRQRFGLPAYLMVDEAQDLDFIQMLYLRALAYNGVSIVMVGDPRQTLYEFRQSVSEWPFDQDFLSALFKHTNINAKVSDHPLLTNYRCRTNILAFAEDASEALVEYAERRRDARNIRPIYDPKESVKRSHPYVLDDSLVTDKRSKSIRFFQGAKTDEIDFLIGKKKAPEKEVKGALKRLAKRTQEIQLQNESKVGITAIQKKLSYIPSLSGGDSKFQIEKAITDLYDRALKGETVAILTRTTINGKDIDFIRQVLRKKHPNIDSPKSVRFNLLSPEKHAPLSPYWIYSSSGQALKEIPFTNILVSAALHCFMSWDKVVSDEIRFNGLREMNFIMPASTPEEAYKKNKDYELEKSIFIELKVFFEGLQNSGIDFFPYAEEDQVANYINSLIAIAARFVCDVFMQYSVVLWEENHGKFRSQPCRFQSICTTRNQMRNAQQLRALNETKRFFKQFWSALVNTPFKFSLNDKEIIGNSGLSIEWSELTTTLLNFPEELSRKFALIEAKGGNHDSSDLSRFEDIISNREIAHEQFSKIYHHKTRTYLREVASQIGKAIRFAPEADMETILISTYPSFRDARYKAKVNSYKKEIRNKVFLKGLFDDFLKGMRDINVQSKPAIKKTGSDIPIINLTTIHSSKGLEWDHVLLYFPKASGLDKDSSFKSARDLLYVAFTRAIRTLSVVISSDKNFKEGESDTCIKVANHIINTLAKKNDLFDADVEFDDLTIKEKGSEDTLTLIMEQTSHSELEKALSCRMHHYIQHKRSLSSMVPLTAPSYSFFFHTAMSSICAGLIGHRLTIPGDPTQEIIKVIDTLISRPDLNEDLAYKSLMEFSGDSISDLMESMIPMYFLSGGDQFFSTMKYYTDMFARQLSAILIGSQLFPFLSLASRLPNHKIWIEKPLRDVLHCDVDGTSVYLPVLGIPDIKISGDQINYVCDYKTIPSLKDENECFSDESLLQVSEKTFTQINFYQGLNAEESNKLYAEVIYVPDITLFEGEEVPSEPPRMPMFNGNSNFMVKTESVYAKFLWTDRFDKERFESTKGQIDELRTTAETNAQCPSLEVFMAAPLVGDDYIEVDMETCRSCSSSVHCQKKKKMEIFL